MLFVWVAALRVLTVDFNYNGTVDAADFAVWKNNLGRSASVLNGNGSGASTVVQADYDLWKENYVRPGVSAGDFNGGRCYQRSRLHDLA